MDPPMTHQASFFRPTFLRFGRTVVGFCPVVVFFCPAVVRFCPADPFFCPVVVLFRPVVAGRLAVVVGACPKNSMHLVHYDGLKRRNRSLGYSLVLCEQQGSILKTARIQTSALKFHIQEIKFNSSCNRKSTSPRGSTCTRNKWHTRKCGRLRPKRP